MIFILNTGLEIATDTVANATNIFSLATKNSGLVAKVATRFLYILDLNLMSKVNTNISYVPNLINKASLPPNLHRLLSMVFSNLMDRAILCRASNRSWKKVQFRGKSRPISRKFSEQASRNAIGKNSRL